MIHTISNNVAEVPTNRISKTVCWSYDCNSYYIVDLLLQNIQPRCFVKNFRLYLKESRVFHMERLIMVENIFKDCNA